MKKIFFLLIACLAFSLSACTPSTQENTDTTDDVEYTCTGLDVDIIHEVGQAVDLMQGVSCTDNNGNNVNDQVTATIDHQVIFSTDESVAEVDENIQSVYWAEYTIGTFEAGRRVIIKNPNTVNPNDLLEGWGMFTEQHISTSFHVDYPKEIYHNVNDLLNCLYIRIESVSESDNWPQYYFDKELTLEASKTYTVSMQIRGSLTTNVRFDIVNFSTVPNETTIDVTPVVSLTTVPVTTSDAFTEVTFEVTPIIDTDSGIFRFILGSSDTVIPNGEIHIDNIEIIENP